MMITITPNPATDEVYTVSNFRPGRWFRADGVNRSPGGRGVNVSIILKQLGYDSVATGFLAGHTGSYIRDEILARGISTNFVNIDGESRSNTFIRDDIGSVETLVADSGPNVGDDALKRFFWNLERLLPRATAVQMGGSLPPGLPDSFFKDAIDIARRRNIPVFVESFGAPLDRAIEALPTVVKINQRFMKKIRDVSLSALDYLIDVSKGIFDEGVDWIVTSYFNRSNLFCTAKGYFLAEIDVENAVTFRAAGDSLMAGMMIARAERMGVEDTIRFSMACVSENIHSDVAAAISRENVEKAVAKVAIQKL